MVTGESASKHAPTPTSYLNEQLKVSELVERLATLRFDRYQAAKLLIDPGVQAFLLAATKAVAADQLDSKVRHAWRGIKSPR
jgi:hypothetical protein